MVNSNVLKAIAEVLEPQNVAPRPGEPMGHAVARALHVSDAQAERWLEALSEGCTVDEANKRAGIARTPKNEPFLIVVARSIGSILGNVTC